MVGKRKKPEDNVLPSRVYRGKSQYEFHPAKGGSISLCPLDSPVSLIWARYEAELLGQADKQSLAGLIADFFASTDFNQLSKETQSDYKKYSKKVFLNLRKIYKKNFFSCTKKINNKQQ